MIITKKKNQEEILKNIEGTDKFFIVGCGSCASKCGTGDEKAVSEMKEFLENNDKKDLLRNEDFKNAESILTLSCGAGNQSVEAVTDKIIIPALDSAYVGTTGRIGQYKNFCSTCGTCMLIETNGICPRTRCAKGLVNGPCGGFVDGKCETDQSKDCAWVLIYGKIKKNNQEKSFLKKYIQPKTNSVD